jgi:non-homologous end joining protein Ku
VASPIRSGVSLSVSGLTLGSFDVMSAVSEPSTGLSMLCDGGHGEHNPSSLNQLYRCPLCSTEGTTRDFPLRGRKVGNTAVILSKDELKELEAPDEVKFGMSVNVHPADEISSLMPTGSVYYLSPAKGAGNAYALFVEVLKTRPDLAMVTTWASRTKAALYRLGVRGDTLTISQLAWPEDQQPAPTAGIGADAKQVDLLTQLLDTSVEGFELEHYVNQSRAKLEELVEAGTPVDATAPKEKSGDTATTLDLTVNLERAIAAKARAAKPKTTVVKKATKVKADV